VLWHCWLGSRKGIRHVKNGGWWRWALVSLAGMAPSRMVGVSACINLPLHQRVQKFSSGTGSPRWSRKTGRKTVVGPEVISLSELITHYLPTRALRSSNTNLLARPTSITSNFTSRAFSVSAPSTWNSLPTHIRSLDKLSTFKRQLKSHLLQSTFTV